MQKLSLIKIFTFIIVVILLAYLKAISSFFGSICSWFAVALDGLNNFSKGAQTAIAFTSVLLVVVLIFKHINK